MEFIHSANEIIMYNDNGSLVAEVTFPAMDASTVNINHTFVDDSLRGQGIAGKLMVEVAEVLRKENKKAKLSCSYARAWFPKHPEYQDVVL
ncbi:MAG: GNAT family N-acetyltransferase [Lachnospiraceae bacterium]